jgi:hypothetical protein
MSVVLNHTIVWCRDKKVSSRYLASTLGLGEPKPWGPRDLPVHSRLGFKSVP